MQSCGRAEHEHVASSGTPVVVGVAVDGQEDRQRQCCCCDRSRDSEPVLVDPADSCPRRAGRRQARRVGGSSSRRSNRLWPPTRAMREPPVGAAKAGTPLRLSTSSGVRAPHPDQMSSLSARRPGRTTRSRSRWPRVHSSPGATGRSRAPSPRRASPAIARAEPRSGGATQATWPLTPERWTTRASGTQQMAYAAPHARVWSCNRRSDVPKNSHKSPAATTSEAVSSSYVQATLSTTNKHSRGTDGRARARRRASHASPTPTTAIE